MTLLVRRIIFYLLALLFVIITPLVIGYTAGFRYNLKQERIIKTGALIIETDPPDAGIALNDTYRKERTPAKIMNLTPGQYRINIIRDGYWDWKKTLGVDSERITFVKDIVLLKNAAPELYREGAIIDVAISPSDDSIVYRSDQSSWSELWKITKDTPSLLWRSTIPSPHVDAIGRGGTLVVRGDRDEAIIFSLQRSVPPFDLGTVLPLRKPKILLDPRESNVVYVLNNGSLTLTNIRTKTMEVVSSSTTDAIILKDRMVLLEGPPMRLVEKQNGNEKNLLTLPSDSYEFSIPESNGFLPLYNRENKNTVLLPSQNLDQTVSFDTYPTIPGKAIGFTRGGEESYFITASSDEIWAYNPRTDHKDLIARFSEPVQNISLMPQGQIILYTTGKSVRAVELDGRDVRSTWELASFDKIEKAILDRQGTVVYVAGSREGQSGLWKLNIR